MNPMKINERNRMMSGIYLILAILAFFALYPATAGANAPKEVKLTYDVASKTLEATITHTPHSESHYIQKVEIKKNGEVVTLQEYTSQTGDTFTYSYKVEAVAGDILEVKASCSRFGSRTAKLTVGQPAEPK
jgi:desulfoferrodoxin (superoxide reductase-like protein)